MGGCAGCMGPSRREENYRVTRLTQNAAIKSRVSSLQLPSYKHQKKIIQQINQQKKRLDQGSLLGVLVNSPQTNANFSKQPQLTSQSVYHHESKQPHFTKENYQTSSMMPKTIRRVQSSLINDNSLGLHSSLTFSNEKNYTVENRSPIISDFRIGSQTRESSKFPLGEVFLNKNSNESMVLKKKTLLKIPQISEEDSKTPLYVKQMRKQNGQDVLRTGLSCVPVKLQAAPQADLFRYIKDLQ